MSIPENLEKIKRQIPGGVTLVAVSKTKPAEDILMAYGAGQKIFGENRVQEMVPKYHALPKDIEWHMLGHMQTNKVKYIAPFVSLIHSADSLRLLREIDKEGSKNKRVINCLLEIHIAQEQNKNGMSFEEAGNLLRSGEIQKMNNVCIRGLMGMATFTDDKKKVQQEFHDLAALFREMKDLIPGTSFDTLSMGMSGDWQEAVKEGSTMVRIGSALFGERN